MLRCFFYLPLGYPTPTLGDYRGDSITHPSLITVCQFSTRRSPGASWRSWVQFLSQGLNSLAIAVSIFQIIIVYYFLIMILRVFFQFMLTAIRILTYYYPYFHRNFHSQYYYFY